MRYRYSSELWALQALSSLEQLDLRGNQIQAMEELEALQHLHGLKILFLEGNPCCSSSMNYPRLVFEMLPSLEILDQWSRSAFTADLLPIAASSSRRPSEMVNDPSSSAPALEVAVQASLPLQMLEVDALRKQLEAMETAFALQERSLATSGVEAAMHNLQHSDPSSSTTARDRERIQSFPYTKLLQTWRSTAVENIHARLVLESQLTHHREAEKSLRQKLRATETQLEAAAIGWKERCNACQSKIDSLQHEVDVANKERMKLLQSKGSLEHQLAQSRRLVQQFR
jgi:hypothetical protein